MIERRIFYSWQSNDKRTANFIEKCLKGVIDELQAEIGDEIKIVFDKDTHGKLGAPDITNTIIEKIEDANVFVADVSCVGECEGRKIVNQNVMFELGYAIAKHTTDFVVMLFNKDNGKMSDLPFDISHRRVTPFSINSDSDGEDLKNILLNVLRPILKNCELIEKLPKNALPNLDDEQNEVMKFFASFEDVIRLSILHIMNGDELRLDCDCDMTLGNAIVKKYGMQRFVAILDDLCLMGVLKLKNNKYSTSYEPTKMGFDIIELIKLKADNCS